MARGQKPAISPKDRLKWLEQLENGKGITAITRSAGRDIRVIKHHIELAKEERQTSRVRQDFLLGKLEQHQQDLLDEVIRLKAVVSRSPPLDLLPSEPLQKKIHDAFTEHIHRMLLNTLLERWEETRQEFEGERDSIKSDLVKREAELKSLISTEIQTLEWFGSILEILEQGTSQDRSSLMNLKYYRHPRVEEQYHPYWGATPLTQNPLGEDRTKLVIKTHEQLAEYSSKYFASFDKWRVCFKELSEQIVDELDVFILKRMVPSRCRYCPI